MNATMKKLTLVLAGAILLFALVFAVQSYFSYKETTGAADACYKKGGFPTIKKSGFKLVYFECRLDETN